MRKPIFLCVLLCAFMVASHFASSKAWAGDASDLTGGSADMDYLNRPHFRFHGDIEEAKTLYMQAWHYLQNMKQSVAPGLGVQGPFRRIFDDGTEFLVRCVAGVDMIEIFVPSAEKEGEAQMKEGWRFLPAIYLGNPDESEYDQWHYERERWWFRDGGVVLCADPNWQSFLGVHSNKDKPVFFPSFDVEDPTNFDGAYPSLNPEKDKPFYLSPANGVEALALQVIAGPNYDWWGNEENIFSEGESRVEDPSEPGHPWTRYEFYSVNIIHEMDRVIDLMSGATAIYAIDRSTHYHETHSNLDWYQPTKDYFAVEDDYNLEPYSSVATVNLLEVDGEEKDVWMVLYTMNETSLRRFIEYAHLPDEGVVDLGYDEFCESLGYDVVAGPACSGTCCRKNLEFYNKKRYSLYANVMGEKVLLDQTDWMEGDSEIREETEFFVTECITIDFFGTPVFMYSYIATFYDDNFDGHFQYARYGYFMGADASKHYQSPKFTEKVKGHDFTYSEGNLHDIFGLSDKMNAYAHGRCCAFVVREIEAEEEN